MLLQVEKWLPVILATIGAVLQIGILYTMKKRNVRSQFPVFFNYNIYVIVAVVINYAAYYFCGCTSAFLAWIYPTLSFLLIGFEFALMYEIFVSALKPYSALIDLGKMLFRWAGAFLLVAAILTAFSTQSSVDRVSIALNILERSMRLMECGLLLLFLLFERKLGLSWRSTGMSIALGLGTSAAAGLVALYLQSRFPQNSEIFYLGENVCYFAVVIFWFASLRAPVASRSNVLDSPSRLIFQRWNEALVSYSHRGEMAMATSSVESFLPGVEQTVERILARKMVQ